MNLALRLSLLAMPLALAGACAIVCTTGPCRTAAAQQFASKENFNQAQIEGDGFTHDVYWRTESNSTLLWIFIEGDGEPWLKDGTGIADNPTADAPLALHLAVQTPGNVAYLGRPCYLSAVRDLRCTPSVWTVDRYSNEVVHSMNAAAAKLAAQLQAKELVLVGHSGGGALAALMASSLANVSAVITIAANLDTDEWNSRHGYWPLSGSRNPANEPPLPNSLVQLHLIGLLDQKVTADMSARYLDRVPGDSVWRYKSFDHTCCWEWDWPKILKRIEASNASLFAR